MPYQAEGGNNREVWCGAVLRKPSPDATLWLRSSLSEMSSLTPNSREQKYQEGGEAQGAADCVQLCPAEQELSGLFGVLVEGGIEEALVGGEDDDQGEGITAPSSRPPVSQSSGAPSSHAAIAAKVPRAASEACITAPRL
jgi:hypothetical protein